MRPGLPARRMMGARDTITDFNALDGGGAAGDLRVIGALVQGRLASLGSAAFTGCWDKGEAMVHGDAAADLSVTLTGLVRASQLSASDFLFS